MKTYSKKDYNSGEGMLTSVWGPGMWHFLHTISFNYPTNPTNEEKLNYKNLFFLYQKHQYQKKIFLKNQILLIYFLFLCY